MKNPALDQTLVSVIMPTHNAEAFLHEAVNSVLEQAYSQWELIISDDHSSDSTRAIAEAFVAKDRRISLITSDFRTGPARTRNRAISVAKGRWLAFLDSDDYWKALKLTETLKFAETNECALTFTSYQKLSDHSKELGRVVPVSTSVTYSQLLKSNQIATSTVVIDRNLYPGLKMQAEAFFDDYVAWLSILKEGYKAMSLPFPLTVYRTGRKSFSSNKIRAAVHVMKIYKDVEKLPTLSRYWNFANYALRGISKTLR